MQLILLNEGTFRSRKLSVSAHVCPRIVTVNVEVGDPIKRPSLVKFLVNFTFFLAQFLICLTEILFFGYGAKSLFPVHE